MNAWLGANCGPDAWAIAPSGSLSVVNDALAIYLLDATIASAFVARSCAAQRIENMEWGTHAAGSDGVARWRSLNPLNPDAIRLFG